MRYNVAQQSSIQRRLSRTRVAIAQHTVIKNLAPIDYEEVCGFHYGGTPVVETAISPGENAAGNWQPAG